MGIHLLEGKVTRSSDSVTLTGTVALDQATCFCGTTVETATFRYTLRNAVVTLKKGAAAKAPTTKTSGGSTSIPIPTPVGTVPEWGFVSVSGSGTLEIGLASGATLLIQDFSFNITPDGTTNTSLPVAINGGRIPWNLCRYEPGQGSSIGPDGTSLKAGVFYCAGSKVESAAIQVSKSGALSGAGRLMVCHLWHNVSFSMSGGRLKATGTTSFSTSGWNKNLVAGYEIEVNGASSTVTVDPGADGIGGSGTLTGTIDFGKITVRTTATQPNGNPWSSGELDPGPVTLKDGQATLKLPTISLGDIFADSRKQCLALADKVVDAPGTPADEHAAARDACFVTNPMPPSIPQLPGSITVFIDSVIK